MARQHRQSRNPAAVEHQICSAASPGAPKSPPGGISTRFAGQEERSNTGSGVRWTSRAVLDLLLQPHPDTEVARTFLTRLLGEDDVPEVIHSDKLQGGVAIRGLSVLHLVEHVQVASALGWNNLTLQSHRSTRQQERQHLGLGRRRRTQEFLALHARVSNLHPHPRATVSAR